MKKILIPLFLLLILFSSCKQKQYELKSLEGQMILMDETFDTNKDPVADSIFNFYKVYAASIMDSVIGYNKVFMDKGLREESLLGNFAADVVAVIAEEIFDTKIDMGLMNRGGLRTSLPQGKITLGDVYKVFPFENYLSVIEITGKDLREQLEVFAKTNVQCVSRIKLTIKDKKLVNAIIDGKPIDDTKIYKIATIDFIAEGNDNMKVLKNAISRTDSPVLIREAIAQYVYDNSPIDAKKDGRVVVLN